MRKFGMVAAVAAIGALPAGLSAADLGLLRHAQCTGTYRSPILEFATSQEMAVEVVRRYDEALFVSEDPQVINSRLQVYDWANEAKVSCAKAIGFLRSGEANAYQISQCDCFHGRMVALMHRH